MAGSHAAQAGSRPSCIPPSPALKCMIVAGGHARAGRRPFGALSEAQRSQRPLPTPLHMRPDAIFRGLVRVCWCQRARASCAFRRGPLDEAPPLLQRVPPALQPNCQACGTVCAHRQLMETGSAPCVSLSLHAAHTRSFPDGARTTMHSHSRAAPTATPAVLHRAQTQLPTRVRAQLPAPTRAPADSH